MSFACISAIWRLSVSSSLVVPSTFPGGARSAAGASGKRREHAHGLGEQAHVLAHLFLHGLEDRAAEGGAHLIAQLLLIAGQVVHREFEIARHQGLDAVPVKPDELPQDGDGEEVLPLLALLLDDDLRQDRAGDVVPGLRVVDEKVLTQTDHLGEILEGHVTRSAGVIEAAIGIFLDYGRFYFRRHDSRYGPDLVRKIRLARQLTGLPGGDQSPKCQFGIPVRRRPLTSLRGRL